jgi:O-antigen/teichoic acid export membrane protein
MLSVRFLLGSGMASLGRDSLWGLAISAASVAGQWGVLAVAARGGSLAMLGELAWALALVLPVHLVAGLQQRTALAAGTDGGLADHLRLRGATALVTLVSCTALAWGLHGAQAAASTALVALARGWEGLGEVALGLATRAGRLPLVAAVAWVRALALPGGAVAGLAFGGGVLGLAAGMAVGSALACAIELPLARGAPHGAPTPPAALLRRLWPLGAGLALAALVGSLPRLLLERSAGPAALGTFAAAATVATAWTTAALSWGPGASVRFGELGRAGDAVGIRRLQRRLAAVGVVGSVVLAAPAWILGDWGLALLFGPQPAGAGALLGALVAVAALDLAAAPSGYALTAGGCWLEQLPVLACAAAIAAGVTALLAPAWGVFGAVAGLAAAHAVRLAWLAALLARWCDRLDRAAGLTSIPPR